MILASVAITLVAAGISLIRFLKGPTILNRVVAFDALGIISISIIVMLAHILERMIYLDVALVYGLLSFLGVLAIARYYEKGL